MTAFSPGLAEFGPPAAIAVLSFVSALVTAVVGFGAGLLLTPLLAIFLPLPEALAIGALIFLVTSSSKVLWYFRDIDWPTWRFGFLLSLPGLGVGFATLLWVESGWLEKVYGVVLLATAVGVIRIRRQALLTLPEEAYPLAGGFLSALLHGGGPMYYCLCSRRGLGRLRTVGTMAVIHFSLNVLKVAFFARVGSLDWNLVVRLLPAGLAAILGTRVGRALLMQRVDEAGFARLVGLSMVLLALYYLL